MKEAIVIGQDRLIHLYRNKQLCAVFTKLLEMIDINDTCIKFHTFEMLAKPLGFKTKSGVWKALRKLQYIGLITIVNNKIYINNRGIFETGY